MATDNGSRLDRVEAMLERMAQRQDAMQITLVRIGERHDAMQTDLRMLLTSQVSVTDLVEKLAGAQSRSDERMDRLTEAVEQLAEAGKHTDERINTLITIVDDIVRRNPPNPE